MKYDKHTLHVAGLILYGPGWVDGMADDLGVNRRTVQRWAKGLRPPHPGVWERLADLCQKRIMEIEKLAAKLAKREYAMRDASGTDPP